ncbi:unnamed protein product [Blepharisma stoltei]|uniref:Histone-lysine N-methyltransferase, H3 lysine-79 specific n=1 Tax=Blepharisma stoltei TaxID=1481888 RepID=A0AAU9JRR8_9CILI|nr:unnamed protein product [Blepharisma stoltei]
MINIPATENLPAAFESYRTEDPYILSEEERLNLLRKFHIYEQLIEEFPVSIGKEASRKERDTRVDILQSESTLTYGEVEFISMGEVFETIKARYGGIPEGGCFYDLGSGTGKGVLTAALLHSFNQCKGIEILQGLYQISSQIKEKYDLEFLHFVQENPDLWTKAPEITFYCGDFFENNLSDASFIFANSTCFSMDMMRRIGSFPFKPGTIGVTFTKSLPAESWEILESIKKNMSWGEATVYIHRKK